MRDGCFRTPCSYTESLDRSAQFSPVAENNAKRTSGAVNRSNRVKATLLPWCVALAVLLIEIFTIGSSIGQFLVGEWLPCAVVVTCEYILLLYIVTVAVWIIYDMFSVSSERGFMHASFGMILPSPYPHSKVSKPHYPLDTSNRADSSWIDDHHFGKVAEESPSLSRPAYSSPNHR
ncbi:hypothetical protein OSTOST_24107 [Ostertagia ostertagi]